MQLRNSTLVVFLCVLAGCSSNDGEQANRTKTKNVIQNHEADIYGSDIEKARKSWRVIDSRQDERLTYHDDLRLPNPELEMYVFPVRNADGSISQGHLTKFSMYEKVHYKVGQ